MCKWNRTEEREEGKSWTLVCDSLLLLAAWSNVWLPPSFPIDGQLDRKEGRVPAGMLGKVSDGLTTREEGREGSKVTYIARWMEQREK